MKIAIISDVHGNVYGLKRVFDEIQAVDKIICAGDFTGYYPFINEVIEMVKKNKIISVKGNHDKYLLESEALEDKSDTIRQSVAFARKIIKKENLEFLKDLPDELNLEIDGKKVLVFHGSPWNKFEERIYSDYPHFEKFETIKADVLILGHTHRPIIKKIRKLTLVNPGSCGQPRDYNLLSYILWDVANDSFLIKRLNWDTDGFIKKARLFGIDEDLFKVFQRVKKERI